MTDFDDVRISAPPRTQLSHPLTVATLNVNGLRDNANRRDLFRHLRSLHLDIVCIQDVRASPLDYPQ